MPHVKIWHFPTETDPAAREQLVDHLTKALVAALDCPADAVSIDVIPVPADRWENEVYRSEIMPAMSRLWQVPGYEY